MTMPALATMSSSGILTEPKQIAEYLFLCFKASEDSQSNLFPVQSLPAIIENCTGRINMIPDECNAALRSLYGAYFETVSSDVRLMEYVPEPEKMVLAIRMTLGVDGKTFDLSKLITKTEGNGFIDGAI